MSGFLLSALKSVCKKGPSSRPSSGKFEHSLAQCKRRFDARRCRHSGADTPTLLLLFFERRAA